ncbi:hypothetical protein JW964_25320 [candidate division KSB1 bacterium]|nr:hypothetical protein [candidate division KSB1 bacterium]
MNKTGMIGIFVFAFFFLQCAGNNQTLRPLNYTLLEQVLKDADKLLSENKVSKVAICNFVNENGNPDRASEQFYNEFYLQFKSRYGSQFQTIEKEVLNSMLVDIKNKALTAYEITALFDKIDGLNGICTAFIGRHKYYLTLFTPKEMYDRDSERHRLADSDWQIEISKLLAKMVKKIDVTTVQPVGISTFDNLSKNTTNALGDFLSYKIYTELHRSYNFNIIHRDDLPQIMKEYELGQTGFLKPEDALEVGKLIGARTILVGKTSGNINKSWYLNLSLIDLSSGQVLWTDDYTKIGSDFFDAFDDRSVDYIDFSNLSQFTKKTIMDLLYSTDEKSSMQALKLSMINLIIENASPKKATLNFTKSMIDTLLSYQRYRMFEIDSIYIDQLKKLKKLNRN